MVPTNRPALAFAITACMTLATLLFTSLANGQNIALTFDDGPDMSDRIGLSPAERNAAILRQLANAHLKSILFVTRTDADLKRHDLIRQWGIEGHGIGNHTATHPDFDELDLADYEQELLTCDKAIRDMTGFTRRFRFPSQEILSSHLSDYFSIQRENFLKVFTCPMNQFSSCVAAHTEKYSLISITCAGRILISRSNTGVPLRRYGCVSKDSRPIDRLATSQRKKQNLGSKWITAEQS